MSAIVFTLGNHPHTHTHTHTQGNFLGKKIQVKKNLGEKKCLKSSEMHKKVVFSQLSKNAYFAYLRIIMHNFNFFVFFPYTLGQYLPPPKRIRIISAIVFGPDIYTDRQTHRHTFPKYRSRYQIEHHVTCIMSEIKTPQKIEGLQ